MTQKKRQLSHFLNFYVFLTVELPDARGWVRFVCMITFTRQHRTKRGDLMMFVEVSDDSARFDVVVMPNLYERTKDLLKKGAIILVEGNIDRPQSCLARTIQAVEVPQQ